MSVPLDSLLFPLLQMINRLTKTNVNISSMKTKTAATAPATGPVNDCPALGGKGFPVDKVSGVATDSSIVVVDKVGCVATGSSIVVVDKVGCVATGSSIVLVVSMTAVA